MVGKFCEVSNRMSLMIESEIRENSNDFSKMS